MVRKEKTTKSVKLTNPSIDYTLLNEIATEMVQQGCYGFVTGMVGNLRVDT